MIRDSRLPVEVVLRTPSDTTASGYWAPDRRNGILELKQQNTREASHYLFRARRHSSEALGEQILHAECSKIAVDCPSHWNPTLILREKTANSSYLHSDDLEVDDAAHN